MARRAQGVSELTGRLRRPTQRRLRIASALGIDERLQRAHQARVEINRPFSPTTGATRALGNHRFGRLRQLRQRLLHRRTRNTRRPGSHRHPTSTQRLGLRPHHQTPLAFVQMRPQIGELLG